MANEQLMELCHEWSKAKKASYNHDYYLRNKEKWKKYYTEDDVASLETDRRKLADKANQDAWNASGKAYAYRDNAKREREEQKQILKKANEAKARGDYAEYERLSKQYLALERSIKGWKKDADAQDKRSKARALDSEMYEQLNNMQRQKESNRAPQAMVTKTAKGTIKNLLRKAKKASSVIGSKACKAGL